jgi:hypothetical protein
MKSVKAPKQAAAYNELQQNSLDGGVKPVLQRLDKEIPLVLIKKVKGKGIDYKIATRHDHRLNPAEPAVETFKKNLISILHGTVTKFSACLW